MKAAGGKEPGGNMHPLTDLDHFFKPASVAVVGATPNKSKGGYALIANMLEHYAGPVYPVNPRYEEILGVECYPSIAAIGKPVELAIVFVPAAAVPAAVEDAGQAGVAAVLVESGGFAETGPEGKRLQDEMMEAARRHGIRVWGPNCTGFVNTQEVIFAPFMRLPNIDLTQIRGNVSIIAQSGMLAAGYILQMIFTGLFKLAKACAIGNKADVDEVEVMEYLAADENTDVVLAYLESIVDGRAFLEAARKTVARKPLIVLKSGATEAAAEAAMSHTASLASADEVIEGALRQIGAFRAHDFMQMMKIGKAFSLNPQAFDIASPEGNQVALVTVTGGGGVVTIDLMASHGLYPAKLGSVTIEKLKEVFPPWMPPSNPVDIWPTIERVGIERGVGDSLCAVLEDPNVDGAILLTFASRDVDSFPAQRLGAACGTARKPIVSWVFGDLRFFDAYRQIMEGQGIPVYDELETCVEAMAAYLTYARARR